MFEGMNIDDISDAMKDNKKLTIDDDPTIPVKRGAAGVYMPEPNEKVRARVGLVQAAERYIATTNCDFDVFDISADNGNVYQLMITKKR